MSGYAVNRIALHSRANLPQESSKIEVNPPRRNLFRYEIVFVEGAARNLNLFTRCRDVGKGTFVHGFKAPFHRDQIPSIGQVPNGMLLYMNKIKPVYHGEHGLRMLKELSRSYLTISKDLGRVMNRLKALYRGWAIPCAGTQVYTPRYRSEWLSKITEAGVLRRAELYYQQLDALRLVRQQARKESVGRG